MLKKLLYCSVILSITTIGSFININASELYKNEIHDEYDNSNSPLRKLFDSSENTLVFNNGVISCNNHVLNTDDYTHSKSTHNSNTIYINTNTLPIHSNTGGGEVFANIAGYDNISLQNFDNNYYVPKSITFYGDNTQYNGVFYLHPNIRTITFDTNDSIIKRLNIPVKHDQIRNITMYIPNEVYASIVKIPHDLSIKFYNNSQQIFPDSNKLKQLIKEHPEYKDTLDKYKITSKSYERYKQNDIKDIEEIVQIFNDLGVNIKLNKYNNIENIDINDIKINKNISKKELLATTTKLTDKFIKTLVKDSIVNILLKPYMNSFSKKLEELGYRISLNKFNNKLIIKDRKNENKYEIRLEGEDTIEVVKNIVKDLSNIVIKITDDEREGSYKEIDRALEYGKKEVIEKLNNSLQELDINNFQGNIKYKEDISKVLTELKQKIEENISRKFNKKINDILQNQDKNYKNNNKIVKRDLGKFKERIEKYFMNIVDKALSFFSTYGYHNPSEYNTMIEDSKHELEKILNDFNNKEKSLILSNIVNYFAKLLGKEDLCDIDIQVSDDNIKINNRSKLNFIGKDDDDNSKQYNILTEENNLIINSKYDDNIILLDTSKTHNEIIKHTLANVDKYQKKSITNTISNFLSYFKIPGLSNTHFRVNTTVRTALRSSAILGGITMLYKIFPKNLFTFDGKNNIIYNGISSTMKYFFNTSETNTSALLTNAFNWISNNIKRDYMRSSANTGIIAAANATLSEFFNYLNFPYKINTTLQINQILKDALIDSFILGSLSVLGKTFYTWNESSVFYMPNHTIKFIDENLIGLSLRILQEEDTDVPRKETYRAEPVAESTTPTLITTINITISNITQLLDNTLNWMFSLGRSNSSFVNINTSKFIIWDKKNHFSPPQESMDSTM